MLKEGLYCFDRQLHRWYLRAPVVHGLVWAWDDARRWLAVLLLGYNPDAPHADR